MAERWQQWMPFHIDRFRGSPEVQAMHPSARIGFLYLLASAWQTDDCTVSPDAIDLATESGLGDELWAQYGPRILRKFEVVDGRYRNAVLFAEWSDALAVYDKRKSGAVRTNSSRSPHAERTQSKRNADTVTGTGTVTSTKKEPKPSRDKREVDPRHVAFKSEIERYAVQKGVLFVWDASEAKQLDLLLKSAPQLHLEGFQRCLLHRARSPGTPHGERPRVWLPNILKYQEGSLDKFGKAEEVKFEPGVSRERQVVTDEQESKSEALTYWRNMRDKGQSIYQQAPSWVKKELEVA